MFRKRSENLLNVNDSCSIGLLKKWNHSLLKEWLLIKMLSKPYLLTNNSPSLYHELWVAILKGHPNSKSNPYKYLLRLHFSDTTETQSKSITAVSNKLIFSWPAGYFGILFRKSTVRKIIMIMIVTVMFLCNNLFSLAIFRFNGQIFYLPFLLHNREFSFYRLKEQHVSWS